MNIRELLEKAIKNKASDLHLSPNMPPLLRIFGELFPLEQKILSKEDVITLIEEVKKIPNNIEKDFSFEIQELGRFRANLYAVHGGIAAVFRLIPKNVFSLEMLQAPPILKTSRLRKLFRLKMTTGHMALSKLLFFIDKFVVPRLCIFILCGKMLSLFFGNSYVYKKKT